MHPDRPPIRHSFVIRIWQEIDSPGWQGLVHHVGSGASAPVRQMADLQRFIEEHIGAQDADEHGVARRLGLR
jgi:hypothetical protein